MADLADVIVFSIEAVVAIALDGSDSASITTEAFMNSFLLDLFVMD